MSEHPQQPNQPPQPPQAGYGYPSPGPGPYADGPYAGGPYAGGPYAGGQAGPYAGEQAGPYGYPQQGHPQGYPQGGYAFPPGTYTGDPHAPYGYDRFGRPYSEKSKIVAGVLQLVLGSFGIGRFYVGNVGLGLAQLFTCGGFGIWALIDGIVLLTGSDQTDAQGRILRG